MDETEENLTVDDVMSHAHQLVVSTRDAVDQQQAALRVFDTGLSGYQCPKHITLGNHEARLYLCKQAPQSCAYAR